MQHAVNVGIMPTLKRKIATAAATDSASANQSTLVRMPLGEDADNVRVDAVGSQVIVAYSGGLAVIDPSSRNKVAEIELKTHPEARQCSQRIFSGRAAPIAAYEIRTIGVAADRLVTRGTHLLFFQ
jgi:hypothetical protein